MAKDKIGVIHGRFQGLHNGHLEYLLAGVTVRLLYVKKEKTREFEIANSISINDIFKEAPLGGTIPLLFDWLAKGMSVGSVAAFMITGPATKITNLGALKIALGAKHFAIYILFVILFSLLTGIFINLIL